MDALFLMLDGAAAFRLAARQALAQLVQKPAERFRLIQRQADQCVSATFRRQFFVFVPHKPKFARVKEELISRGHAAYLVRCWGA